MILILEDDAGRVRGFHAALARVFPGMPVIVWSSAHTMIAEVADRLPRARLISLDHDLYAPDGSPDPGDGLMVAKYLASQHAACPVIVHTSNSERGNWMMGEFELGGWPCTRVLPIESGWIERDWIVEAKRLTKMPSSQS